MTEWHVECRDYPNGTNFCQFTAPTWDGETGGGQNAGEDCGPTCVSSIIQFKRGVYVPPDVIADWLLNNGYGITNAEQLASALERSWRLKNGSYTDPISARVTLPTSRTDLLNRAYYAGYWQHPMIVQRHLRAPGTPDYDLGHWMVGIGQWGIGSTITAMESMNPETGAIIREDMPTFWEYAAQGPSFGLPQGCFLLVETA